MTETREPVPHDDRLWPARALPMSIVVGVALVGTGIGLVVAAAGRGSTMFVITLAGTLVAAVVGGVYMTTGQRRRIEGRMTRRAHAAGEAGTAGALLVVFVIDRQLAFTLACGFIGVGMLANARMIRIARANRPPVAQPGPEDVASSPAWAEPRPVAPGPAAPLPPPRPTIGQLLNDAVATLQRRWLAWLVAGGVSLPAAMALGASDAAVGMIFFVVVIAVPVALLRFWPLWRSRRRFARAEAEPRRAYVAVAFDAVPHLNPLVGVWSQPPFLAGGRVPRPDRGYRIDPRHDALVCGSADPVVHEAWVDTSSRRPRWVVADAGLVVPRRWSPLGRFYVFSQVIQLAPPLPLTVVQPHPATEPATDTGFDRRRLGIALAQRLAVFLVLAVVFSLE